MIAFGTRPVCLTTAEEAAVQKACAAARRRVVCHFNVVELTSN